MIAADAQDEGVAAPAPTLPCPAGMAAAHALKARYFRLMDLKRWDEWEALYVPDAEMDVRGEAAAMIALGFPAPDSAALVWRGAAAIRDAVAGALAGVTTVHHGHMGEFTAIGGDRIEAIWAMEDRIRYAPGSKLPVAGFNGCGHYHDTYVRTDAGWRIARVELRRLLVEPLPRHAA